jgi:hypothetical protein
MGDRMSAPMRAITILQPYPFAILRGWKRMECRSWLPPKSAVGERIAIHAGLSTAKLLDPAVRAFFWKHGELWPDDLPLGAVVGTALLTNRVLLKSRSPWFRNAGEKYGWMLEEPFQLPRPVAARGNQGLWWLPDDVLDDVRGQELNRGA